jgi:regulator of protease activity HflC (stomatin/prohibitin superfamily)
MAQSLHWEGLRMRLLIELPLTIAFFTLAVKYGWPYTVVFVLGYILAFNFKLTYLSRRARISTRFLVFLGVFLAFAMTTSMIIGRFFFSPNNQAWIEAHRIWNFLLVTPALKILWAAVMGFGLIALLAAVILIPYGQVAGQQMYSQYEQYKGHEGEAARAAINILLGISGGTWVINNGQAELKGDPNNALARFGGPGFLIVQEGHAVILEVSGKLSRIVGRGITWLKPFERISMVVPLFLRTEKLIVEQVATKDKVLIQEFELLVFHKADTGPEEERIQDGQFAYTTEKLLNDVWSPNGGDWRGGVRSVADTATRDVVGRYDLEQIVPISDAFRTAFKQLLVDQMNKVTKEKMGVVTITVDIGKVRIPEEAERRLMSKWSADWDIRIALSEREATLRRGEAEAIMLKVKEVAWAQAQKQIIEEITAGFRSVGVADSIQAPYIIALRSLETLEKMAADPATKILLPYDMMNQLQGLRQVVQESTPLLTR